MKKLNINNKNGVTLVTVLLIITVFSILGISVIDFTISNTKQVKKTEQDMQVVDVAEMGVIYYKNAFISQTDKILRQAIENAMDTINKENEKNKENEEINSDTILEHLIIQDDNFLPNIPISTSIPVNENSDYSFKINYQKTQVDETFPNKIKIIFESLGEKKGDNAKIIGTITLDIEKIIKASLIQNEDSSETGTIGNDRIIQKPNLPNRTYNEAIGIENGYSYTTDIENYNFDIDNKTAIVNGSLTLNTTKKHIRNNPLLYITQDADFGDINGQLDHSKIYVGGNTTFSDVSGGIKNSILYIGGDATFLDISGGISDHTTLYIVGNAEFGGKITSGVKNSTVCVGKTISGKLSFEDDNVYSWKDNEDVCGPFQNTSSQPILSDLLPNIADQTNNLKLEYN